MKGIFTNLVRVLPAIGTIVEQSTLLSSQTFAKAKEALNQFCEWVKQRSSVCSEFILSLLNLDALMESISTADGADIVDTDSYNNIRSLYEELVAYAGLTIGDDVPLQFTDINGEGVSLLVTKYENIYQITDHKSNIIVSAFIQDGVRHIFCNQVFKNMKDRLCNIADFIRGQADSLSINEVILQVRDLLNGNSFSLDTLRDSCERWINKGSTAASDLYQAIRRSFVASGITGVITYLMYYIKTILSGSVTNEILSFTDNRGVVPADIVAGFLGITSTVLSVAWNVVRTALDGIAGIIAGIVTVTGELMTRVSELVLCHINDDLLYDVYPATALGYFQHEFDVTAIDVDLLVTPSLLAASEGSYVYLDVPGGLLICGPGSSDNLVRIEFHPGVNSPSDAACVSAMHLEKFSEDITTVGYTRLVKGVKASDDSNHYLTPNTIWHLFSDTYQPEITVANDGAVQDHMDNMKILKNITRNMCGFWCWVFFAQCVADNGNGFNIKDMMSFCMCEAWGPFSNFFNGLNPHFCGVNPITGLIEPNLLLAGMADDGFYVVDHANQGYSDDWFRGLANDLLVNFWQIFIDYSPTAWHTNITLDWARKSVYNSLTNAEKREWTNWASYGLETETTYALITSPDEIFGELQIHLLPPAPMVPAPVVFGYGSPKYISSWASGLAVPLVDLPKVSNSSLTLFMAAVTGIAVAVAIIVPVVTRAVKMAKLRAQGKVERAWQTFSEDPTEANLKAYRKTVFTNNIKTFFLGGTCFDATNYWNSTSWSENALVSDGVSSVGDHIHSLYNSQEVNDTTLPISNEIVKLIKGSR